MAPKRLAGQRLVGLPVLPRGPEARREAPVLAASTLWYMPTADLVPGGAVIARVPPRGQPTANDMRSD